MRSLLLVLSLAGLVVANVLREMTQAYEELLEDQQTIRGLLTFIRGAIQREERKEHQLRMKLVRSRLHQCALGYEMQCDLFHPLFYTEDELLEEGIPNNNAKEKKRLVTDFDIEEELRLLSPLTGSRRVRRSICPNNTLLPDDVILIWKTFGEYADFMGTPAGRVSVEPTPTQRRREALFGRYLEYGHKGAILAAMHLIEFSWLVLSPLSTITWAVRLSLTAASDSLTLFLPPVLQRSLNSLPLNRGILGSLGVDESQWQQLLGYFNPYRYGWAVSVLDRLHPYSQSLRWTYTVFVNTPRLYYDLWLTSKERQLPQRRQACLLRQGLAAGTAEAVTISQELRSLEAHIQRIHHRRQNPELFETDRRSCLAKEINSCSYTFCDRRSIYQGSTLLGYYDETHSIAHSREDGILTRFAYISDLIFAPFGYSVVKNISTVSGEVHLTYHFYNNGDICSLNGRFVARSVSVEFLCKEVDTIIDVVEGKVTTISI